MIAHLFYALEILVVSDIEDGILKYAYWASYKGYLSHGLQNKPYKGSETTKIIELIWKIHLDLQIY